MIFDSTNKFSSSQAFTATAVSTNVIDLGVSNSDLGLGEAVPLWVGVDTTFTGLTSVAVTLQTDDDEAFGTAVDVISTGAIAVADLVNGYQFALQAAPKNVLGQYIRLKYTVVGTGTAGTISAGITLGNA